MNDCTYGGDVDAFITRRSRVEAVARHPLGDCFAVIVAHIFDRRVGVPEPRAGKVPVKVRVCQIERIPTAFAFSARRVFSFAKEHLPEPEGEALLSDSAGAMKEQACRQGTRAEACCKAFPDVSMPVEAGKWHEEIWHVS
jgi:hypothetical protein